MYYLLLRPTPIHGVQCCLFVRQAIEELCKKKLTEYDGAPEVKVLQLLKAVNNGKKLALLRLSQYEMKSPSSQARRRKRKRSAAGAKSEDSQVSGPVQQAAASTAPPAVGSNKPSASPSQSRWTGGGGVSLFKKGRSKSHKKS